MTISRRGRWRSRLGWIAGGAIVGAALVYCLQVAQRLNLPGKWDPDSTVSIDTLGTWLGTFATIAIAAAGWLYGRRISRQQRHAESLQARNLATEVQFRVRPVLGANRIWSKWRVVLYTAEKAPATDVEVRVDGTPIGDMISLLRSGQNKPWGFQPELPLNMPMPTTDIKSARAFIRSQVRNRIELRFTIEGYRFSRTAGGLESLGQAPVFETIR